MWENTDIRLKHYMINGDRQKAHKTRYYLSTIVSLSVLADCLSHDIPSSTWNITCVFISVHILERKNT